MGNKTLHAGHILIVDDTSKNIQLLANILNNEDYKISAARDGFQAIELSDEIDPDLILLDIMMPEMDGFDTCKRLREKEKLRDVPIIFLTAKNESDDIVKGLKLGAVDYITKPFNSAELLMRVKTHLDLRKSKTLIKEQASKLNELLHVMFHDLTNPLNFLSGILEIAEHGDSSILEEMQDSMRDSVKNALDIISIVRKLRALEDGKEQITLSSLNLKDKITESCAFFRQKLKDKEIHIEIDINPAIYIIAENISFNSSVVSNLLSNAIKFSFPQSKISVSGYLQEDKVIVSVRDYGIGMPESLVAQIFDHSRPTNRTGTNGEKGTGYGMPLVKKFVTLYGGGIHILSTEKNKNPSDHGTEIRLTLKGEMRKE